MMAESVLILFTGGRDSTASFLELRGTGAKCELFTGLSPLSYDLGLRQVRLTEVRAHISPEALIAHERQLHGLIYELVVKDLVDDILRDRRQFILIGEFVALLAAAVDHARLASMSTIAYGAVSYQSHLPEQHPALMEVLSRFAEEQGVRLVAPVYEWSEIQVKERLRSEGLSTKSLESTPMFGSPLEDDVATHLDEALAYVQRKCERATEILARRSEHRWA